MSLRDLEKLARDNPTLLLDLLIEEGVYTPSTEFNTPTPSSTPPKPVQDPRLWAEFVSQTELDPWQVEVISSPDTRLLLNCSRQSGKSQITSLRAAYRAAFLNRTQIVIAPTLRQSSVIFRRMLLWLEAGKIPIERSTATFIELSSGTTVHCLPGDRPDFVRGLTGDDLLIDEASRIKASLIAAVTPIIATRPLSTITMLSTPAGRAGAFYSAWTSELEWKRIRVPAELCPRISPKFLAEEKSRLGDALFSQEYQCQFIADSFSVLDPEAILDLFKRKGDVPDPTFRAPDAGKEVPLWYRQALD